MMEENQEWLNRNYNENEVLMTDEEHALLIQDDYVVTEDTANSPKSSLLLPSGTFKNGRYYPPELNRKVYIQAAQSAAVDSNYADYTYVNEERLPFVDRVHTLNYFHPDFVRTLNIALSRYGDGPLVAIRGMTPRTNGSLTPHNVGMAIDIAVSTNDERKRLMNAAWLAGFPTIVQAGGGSAEAHIHLDICPHEPFVYDGQYYEGPWSL